MKQVMGALILALACFAGAQDMVMLGDWGYIEQIDPITDANTSGAVALASQSPSYYQGALIVRCSTYIGSEIDLFFDSDQYLGSDDLFSVVYRIDGGEPQSGWWDVSTDNTAVFVPDRDLPQLVTALAGASEMVIRVQAYDGPQTYIIPVSGFREVLDAMGCYTGSY
ncbi:MAG TPA: hypothetical protein VF202_03090 [Trueperaceae bacterium]